MPSKTDEDDRPAQYILGTLPEDGRARLEAEYFEDDDAFEQMLIAEEELTDSYVRGELSAEDRARFEKSYLSSPRGCERVQFARALSRAVSDARDAGTAGPEPTDAPRASLLDALRARAAAWRFAFAAVALIAAAGLALLLVERARIRDELRGERASLGERVQEMERRAAAEQSRSGEPPAQPEGERASNTQDGVQTAERVQRPDTGEQGAEARRENDASLQGRPSADEGHARRPQEGVSELRRNSIVMLSLTPGLARGGGVKTLDIPRGASSIVIRLSTGPAGMRASPNAEATHYVSYRAVIETAGGREVWRADSVAPPSADGTVALPAAPARSLSPGDYVLLLSAKRPDGGFEGVADYSFKVVRK